MRRLICFVLCLMLAVMLAIPAVAAETTQIAISPSAQTADPGDELTFTVTIDGSEECRYYGLILDYDADVYEVTGGECTVEGAMFAVFDPERGFVVLYTKKQIPSGTIGTFTLKVKEDAAAGAAPVSGRASVKNGSDSLACSVTDAAVTISGTAAETESTTPPQTEPEATQKDSSTAQKKPTTTQNSSATTVPAKPQSAEETTLPAETVPAETEMTVTEATAVSDATAEVPAQTQGAESMQTDSEQSRAGQGRLAMAALILVAAAAVCAVLLIRILTKGKKKK